MGINGLMVMFPGIPNPRENIFGDNKTKMARKPGKKLKENPVGCTGEGKI